MPTIIDSLVVELGLDSKKFDQGQKNTLGKLNETKKAADKTGNDIALSGKKGAEFFGQMEAAALKFFAVITAGRGMADFVSFVTNTGANLSRLSMNTGESVEGLSKWAGAVEVAGGSAQAFYGTVKNLSKQFQESQMGGAAGFREWMAKLNITNIDPKTGKLKSELQFMQDVGERLRKEKDKRKAFVIGSEFIDEGTLNLMLRGKKAMNDMINSQKGMSQSDADRARLADERWTKVKQNIEAISREIVIKLYPTLEKMARGMEHFAQTSVPIIVKVIDELSDLDKATNGWSTTLIIVIGSLKMLGGFSIINGLAAVAGKLLGIGTAATTAMGASGVSGILGVASALGLITAAFYSEGLNKGEQESLNAIAGEDLTTTKTKNAAGGDKVSIAQRFNNPGDIRFNHQANSYEDLATRKVDKNGKITPGFAVFKSIGDGYAALAKQLKRYQARGIDTIDEFVDTYAPSNENDTLAYKQQLSALTGFARNKKLDYGNIDILKKMMFGISKKESIGNANISDQNIMTGINMAGMGGNSTKNISIGQVTIHTQATDAKGIVRDFGPEMTRQADSGQR